MTDESGSTTDVPIDTQLDIVLGEFAVSEFASVAAADDRRYDEVFGRFFGAFFTDGLSVSETDVPWSDRQHRAARAIKGIYSLEAFERGLMNRDPLLERHVSGEDMALALDGVQFALPGQAMFGRIDVTTAGNPVLVAGGEDEMFSLRPIADVCGDDLPQVTALLYLHDAAPPKMHIVPMERAQFAKLEATLTRRWGHVFADGAATPALGDFLGCELRRDPTFGLASQIVEPPQLAAGYTQA